MPRSADLDERPSRKRDDRITSGVLHPVDTGAKQTRKPRFEIWTGSQRGVLIALLAGILLYTTVRFALNPAYVSDPQPDQPARYHELADRIDPNEADWQTLAALPALGEKRAKDLVAYRERYTRDHPGRRAFDRPEDLMRVRGFGRAMVATLAPYLAFPQPAEDRPATAPSPTIAPVP